jgi:hypothetical protein
MTLARRFRTHERREVRMGALVEHLGAAWRVDARVANVSLGGACLELARAISEGDQVRVDFMAPSLWDPLAIRARVVWSYFPHPQGPGRFGIAFEHAEGPAVLALFELICSHDY